MANSSPHRQAQRHLSRRCPIMKSVIASVGPCTLAPSPHDPFTLLVRCVLAQQITGKAAQSIFDRLATAVGGPPLKPAALAKLKDQQLVACGISGPKQRAIRALTEHCLAKPEVYEAIESVSDDALREELTAIKGIGPWTVDMFLMFSIMRPDVLPIGDYGIKAGMRLLFELDDLPTPTQMTELAKPWMPYRTIACWYVWRALEAEKARAKSK